MDQSEILLMMKSSSTYSNSILMKQLLSSRLLGALTVMAMQKMEKKLEMTVEGTTMMHEMTQNPLIVVR